MLYFLTRRLHMYTVRVFQQYVDADYLRILPHEELDTHGFGPGDVAVFCDIDRCNDEQLEDLKAACSDISKTGCRILNDPGKVLRRYPLLRGLHADRSNAFQVYRPQDLSGEPIRFPVFVRDELEHNGPSTELLHSHAQLVDVLAGSAPLNPLVCEFIDTAAGGHHHKYGAFVLDGTVLPRHFFLSDAWNVKSASGDVGLSRQQEIDYLARNPHADELRRIAAYAHIDFGRIDYAVTDKGIQVFEINTNPMIIDRKDIADGNPRQYITERFIAAFSGELRRLASARPHDQS